MIYYIAIIKDSQILTLKMASGKNEPEGVREDGSTVVHVDFPIENKFDFISSHYWEGEWKERPLAPNNFSRWVDGTWVWDKKDLMNEIRGRRNIYLSRCDWTRMDDNGLDDDDREIWAIYRQELRDITKNLDTNIQNVNDVVWPESP